MAELRADTARVTDLRITASARVFGRTPLAQVAPPPALVDTFVRGSSGVHPVAQPRRSTAAPSSPKLTALSAVKENARAYLALPRPLRRDPDIALAAFCADPYLLTQMPMTLRTSTAFALRIARETKLPLTEFAAAVRRVPALRHALIASDYPTLASSGISREAQAAFAAFLCGEPLTLAAQSSPEVAALCATSPRLCGGVSSNDQVPLSFDRSIDLPALADPETWLLSAQLDPGLGRAALAKELLAVKAEPARWAALVAGAEAIGIRWPERFTQVAMLERVLADSTATDNRPVALVVAARWDTNGFTITDEWYRDFASTHRIVYREASSSDDVSAAFVAQASQPADKVFVLGHGTPLSVQFGRGRKGLLTYDDVLRFQSSGESRGVRPSAELFCDSCNTGEGHEGAHNMANAFASAFGARVHAPDEDIERVSPSAPDQTGPRDSELAPFNDRFSLARGKDGEWRFLSPHGVRRTYDALPR